MGGERIRNWSKTKVLPLRLGGHWGGWGVPQKANIHEETDFGPEAWPCPCRRQSFPGRESWKPHILSVITVEVSGPVAVSDPFCFWQTGSFYCCCFALFSSLVCNYWFYSYAPLPKKKDIWPVLKKQVLLALEDLCIEWSWATWNRWKGNNYLFLLCYTRMPWSPCHLHHLAVLIKERRTWQPVEGCSLVLPGLPWAAGSLWSPDNLSFLLCPNNLWQ